MTPNLALVTIPLLLEGKWGREEVFVVGMKPRSTKRSRLLKGEDEMWVWAAVINLIGIMARVFIECLDGNDVLYDSCIEEELFNGSLSEVIDGTLFEE